MGTISPRLRDFRTKLTEQSFLKDRVHCIAFLLLRLLRARAKGVMSPLDFDNYKKNAKILSISTTKANCDVCAAAISAPLHAKCIVNNTKID